MEPTPQPSAPATEGVEASTQPAQAEQQTAVQPQEPQSQNQQEPTAAQVDETAAWLQSKGLNQDDPEFMDKVLKMAYNSEKQMTKAAQEASELRKLFPSSQQPSVPQPGVDPNVAVFNDFVQTWQQDRMLQQFKETHEDWSNYSNQMSDILTGQVATPQGTFSREDLVNAGVLSLDDIYVMAKGSTPVNTDEIQTQAKQEVLQTLANTQRAGAGNANASTTNPQAPKIDPVMEGFKRSRGQ